MRSIITYGLAAIAGVIVGPVSILAGMFLSGPLNVSDWTSNWAIGSEQANPYVRAYVSVFGLLALSKEEAVYFNRRVDDDGERLSEACIYRLSGKNQPSRWWSITLYDTRGYLPLNDDGAPSVDATRVGEGDWEAIISPSRDNGEALWVSSRNSGTFDLTLRLYKPSDDLLARPETELNPPSIERLSCVEGGS